jgi:hypothetical protein
MPEIPLIIFALGILLSPQIIAGLLAKNRVVNSGFGSLC